MIVGVVWGGAMYAVEMGKLRSPSYDRTDFTLSLRVNDLESVIL
ncbi:hypothetical protein [Echinicola strongylocentroti]|nr:hypothetical protein [Echinicola strongylocentroti]